MAIQTGQSELAAAIYQSIIDEIPDARSRLTAFFKHITEGDSLMKKTGLYVQFPIKLIANASSGFIPLVGAVTNTTPSTQLQYGVLNWKGYNYNLNLSLQEMNAVNGPTEQVDYIEGKTKGATDDANRELSLAMVAGSSATNPLSFDSLLQITAASGTTYAGLLNTDYAANAYLPYIDTATTVNYNTFNTMLNQIKARMQQGAYVAKDLMGLTNQNVYSRLLNSIQAQQIFKESTLAESGFEGIKVNGCEMFMDADVTGSQDGSTADNYMYIFPKSIMKFAYNFGFGNSSIFDGAQRLPNQPVWTVQHYITGNLICNNRRLVAVNKTLIA